MLSMLYLISLFLFYSCASCFLFEDKIVSVNTNVGTIQGISSTLQINGTEKTLHTFLGIPYAEPPTGLRRFQKPVPKAAFKSAFNAYQYGDACLQFREGQTSYHNITFSEDCLSLNIFAPGYLLSNGERFPVMIYIHGGGFLTGFSIGHEGRYLSLSGDVIVVTINYRLNVFGFLSTGDSYAAGNYGLWDQQLAIKWIHDNIQAFGGDTNRVMIFGESAGAGSVTYQTIYPGNKGLFQRAVAESGSFAAPWAFNWRSDASNFTTQFAISAGCLKLDSSSVVNCLQSKSASEIKRVMDGPLGEQGLYIWSPVIDNDFVFSDPMTLLTENYPSKQVKDMFLGVDLIMGVNSKEGFAALARMDETFKANFSKADIDNILIPKRVNEPSYLNKYYPKSVTTAAILEYTDWNHLDDFRRQVHRLVDLISDYWFNVGVALTAKRHAESSARHTFVYKLSTSPPRHLIPVLEGLDGPKVVDHSDELIFLLGPWFRDGIKIPYDSNKATADEMRNVGKAMVTMWTNFAKSG